MNGEEKMFYIRKTIYQLDDLNYYKNLWNVENTEDIINILDGFDEHDLHCVQSISYISDDPEY